MAFETSMTNLTQPNSSELQKIKKDKTVLITDYYNTPNTSLLIFHFEPHCFKSSHERIQTCLIHHASIESKDLYIFDNYFQENEQVEIRNYFGNEKTMYSRYSYSTSERIKEGEKPGYSMNMKERWKLFSNPPQAIQEAHKLLSYLSFHLNAEISTAPWELCHEVTEAPTVAPSVIVNFHTEVSKETMEIGKHQDFKPDKGVFFGIPVLYKNPGAYHDPCFENGATGKPWLVSLMLYSSSEHFLPEHRMGSVFYTLDGKDAVKVNCQNSRFVLFEGDILHNCEESTIPPGLKLWRISYVLKLIINPRNEKQRVKEMFSKLLRSPLNEMTPGANTRI